jgi:hypothetical protein
MTGEFRTFWQKQKTKVELIEENTEKVSKSKTQTASQYLEDPGKKNKTTWYKNNLLSIDNQSTMYELPN